MKKYVVGFMFSPDRQFVVLIRKNRPEWQAGKLNGIGGKTEEGEFPRQAMVREFREETGVETPEDSWEIKGRIEGVEERIYILRAFSGAAFDVQTATDEKVELHCVDGFPYNAAVSNLQVLLPAMLLEGDFEGIFLTYR